jgi:hypothetical protein
MTTNRLAKSDEPKAKVTTEMLHDLAAKWNEIPWVIQSRQKYVVSRDADTGKHFIERRYA